MRFAFLLGLLFCQPWVTQAQDCVDDLLCLEAIEDDDLVHLILDNRSVGTVTIRFDLDLENMVSDQHLPLVGSYPGEARSHLLTLTVEDVYEGWGYRSLLEWLYGSLDARHDDRYLYGLPYARGTSQLLGQGYGGRISHTNLYALDFNLAEGTAICAAREGVVVDLKDTYSRGGLDERFKKAANYIAIQHADGTIGQYAHLQRGGARVSVGDRVQRGQVIGLSGNTGYTTGPHLHFEVFTIGPDMRRRSHPVAFDLPGRRRSTLKEGQVYRHE